MLDNNDRPMSKQESYIQRRQLFKSIWETAMKMNEKDIEIAHPKVIKTLRMEGIDEFPVDKSKKQRIRNLRHVCNRILEFCDKHDANENYGKRIKSSNEKTSPKPEVPSATSRNAKYNTKKKLKTKKKINKTNEIDTTTETKHTDEESVVPKTNVIVQRLNTQALSSKESSTSSAPSTKQKPRVKKDLKKRNSKVKKNDDVLRKTTLIKPKPTKHKRVSKKVKTASDPKPIPQIISV